MALAERELLRFTKVTWSCVLFILQINLKWIYVFVCSFCPYFVIMALWLKDSYCAYSKVMWSPSNQLVSIWWPKDLLTGNYNLISESRDFNTTVPELSLKIIWAWSIPVRSRTEGGNQLKFLFSHLVVDCLWPVYSLKTLAELAVLCIYVENQAILEPILFNRASKCKT